MRAIWLIILAWLTVVQAQAATEIQPGVIYNAGSDLSVSNLGLQLRVPQGFRAALPQGTDVLLMESDDQSRRMLVSASAGSEAEVEQFLSQPYAIDEYTQLLPEGEPRRQALQWLQSYEVAGLADPSTRAVALVRLSKTGIALLVLTLYTEFEGEALSAAQQMLDEAQFNPPKAVSRVQAVGPEINWQERLRGAALRYLKTENGFSANRFYYLCSDQNFVYADNDSYASSDALSDFSYAGQANHHGQWHIRANRLQLLWADGGQSEFLLSRRYVEQWDEWGTFLNDERWFEVNNTVCP